MYKNHCKFFNTALGLWNHIKKWQSYDAKSRESYLKEWHQMMPNHGKGLNFTIYLYHCAEPMD